MFFMSWEYFLANLKKGPQEPQKFSSLKSLKFQKKPYRYQVFSLLLLLEMAFLSNYQWQNRPNRSTNNGDMAQRTIRPLSE